MIFFYVIILFLSLINLSPFLSAVPYFSAFSSSS